MSARRLPARPAWKARQAWKDCQAWKDRQAWNDRRERAVTQIATLDSRSAEARQERESLADAPALFEEKRRALIAQSIEVTAGPGGTITAGRVIAQIVALRRNRAAVVNQVRSTIRRIVHPENGVAQS